MYISLFNIFIDKTLNGFNQNNSQIILQLNVLNSRCSIALQRADAEILGCLNVIPNSINVKKKKKNATWHTILKILHYLKPNTLYHSTVDVAVTDSLRRICLSIDQLSVTAPDCKR